MGENTSLCTSQSRKRREYVPTGIAFSSLVWEGRLWDAMSTSLAINYFPHSQTQEVSSIAKSGLSVGKPELWEDFKK